MASSSFLETIYTGLVQGNFSTLLSPALAHASSAFEQLLNRTVPAQPKEDHETSAANELITQLVDFFYSRSALENTSLLVAISTFFVLAMSWTSRLGNLGRFSPFTRSPPQGSTKVSDADFSYITADDLRRHQAESQKQGRNSSDDSASRETDSLTLRNKKNKFTVHLPIHSLADGEITIGQLRDIAAKKTGADDVNRVKLLYRGKNLKDDHRTCREEGVRHGAEIMCTVAESVSLGSPSDSEDDDGELADGSPNDQGGVDGESKRRRNRGKKTKRRNKREDRDGNLGVPVSQGSSRSESPGTARQPETAIEKIAALRQTLHKFRPEVDAFKDSPSSDQAKKEYEHKRLSETILTQVLLKLDAVETEGDTDARNRRKELVHETQMVLQELDAVMKS